MKCTIVVVFMIFIPMHALADLAACVTIQEDQKRLKCYDMIMGADESPPILAGMQMLLNRIGQHSGVGAYLTAARQCNAMTTTDAFNPEVERCLRNIAIRMGVSIEFIP